MFDDYQQHGSSVPVRGLLIVCLIVAVGFSYAMWDWARSAEREYERNMAIQRATNAALLEYAIRMKELKCENLLIATGDPFPHRSCHNRYREEWSSWARQFPERAQEKAASLE